MSHRRRTARLAVVSSLLVALLAPVAASAGTDPEFDRQLREAATDMPVAQSPRLQGELPGPDPQPAQPTPTPAPATGGAGPAPLAPAPAVAKRPATKAPVVKTRCRTSGRTRRCETRSDGQLAQLCTTKRRVRTCTTYRDGKPAKRCVRTAGRNRCRTLSPAVGRASQLTWNGWPSQLSPAVGKILAIKANGLGSACTGTVVSRTLMLTAAHCLYEGGYHRKITFAPSATAAGDGSLVLPYGKWEASNWWVPEAYKAGDMSFDYGLVEIPPVGGRYLGDVTGSWSITPGLKWANGRHAYLMGYPATGFWATAAGYFGNGQYGCDVNWDEGYSRSGSGYDLWATCTMNGGASGGPWFVEGADGRWTIGGVNSRCYGPVDANGKACVPKANYMISSYIDNRFYDFWNLVNGQRRV